MDEVDSTIRKPKAKNRHITELEQKLAERRANRLTADMTSESDDDNVGDLDFGRTNRFSKNRSDSSSNWQPDLGATLKFRDRDALLNTLNEDRPSRFMKKSNMNIKNIESPRDNQSGFTAEDILSGRKTPTISDGRKSPFLNRKSPLSSQKENGHHDWQPLSYQKKAPSPDFLNRDRSFDSIDSHERGLDSPRKSKTDKSPRLEPLESPKEKPSPRPRRGSEEIKKKRSTPTMDLFGSRRNRLDEDEDEEQVKEPTARAERRLSKDKDISKSSLKGRKTPTEDGRKTPTVKRKSSPDVKKTLDGRKTPTAQGRQTPVEGRKTPTKEKSEPSLMEMMMKDEVDTKPSPRRRKSLLKETSHDSITQEVNGSELRRSTSTEKRRNRGNDIDADQSSVCEEYEVDPNPPLMRSNPEPKPREYKHQTEEHERCDNAIDFVEKAQNGMTYIDPDQQNKSEKKNKTMKPKPRSARHSPLPGQTLSTMDIDPNDTKAMRQAIFNVWYAEKTKRLKEELQKKKMEEKEKKEKEEQEKKDKILEAQSSYNAWAEKKKDVLKEKVRQKTKGEKEKEEALRGMERKKEYAKKSFEIWKETKDAVLVKEVSKKKRKEMEKKKEEEMKKMLRSESASSAFTSWKKMKKEEYLEKKCKEEKKKKPVVYREELEREARDRKAREDYEIWLENKEKQQEMERRMR